MVNITAKFACIGRKGEREEGGGRAVGCISISSRVHILPSILGSLLVWALLVEKGGLGRVVLPRKPTGQS